ncbi:ATP-binding protein [Gemmata sp. JC717]|uniref:ATP-binding response regulator n=1 Tax=Gemmata algarum TaxID=2975278 RepID=UPI0021BBA2B8|nr:PAS domain-containing sensor histidine kinase [Gemmata algarum]MDY3555964.1 ATP-binding protein [Gemmata algarum]
MNLSALALVLVGLSPLVLLCARAGRWPPAIGRAYRGAAAAAAVCVLAAAWAGPGLPYLAVTGAVVPLALVGAAFDRTARERRPGAEPHRDRLRLLDAALGASRDGVLVTATRPTAVGLQIVYANPAFEGLTGYGIEEALGQSPSMLYTEDCEADRETVRAALRSDAPGRFEVPARRKDGTQVCVEWDVVPVPGPPDGCEYRVAVLRDTTERRRLEEQLRNAAKLEAVGRLAAGVAHDFNNLLTVIGGSAALLDGPAGQGPNAPRLVGEVRFAAERGRWLVRQLLTFARPQAAVREPLDLGRVASDLAPILARVVGPAIETDVRAPAEPVFVLADRGELEQVLLNLATNARDAMPEGGRLALQVRAGADGVRLTVADTGAGMPPEVRAHIFEPFFTTKGPDAGTGLGLATVKQVVERCGGRIAVASAPGRGTAFDIDLPRCPAPAPGGTARPALLAEDEPGVRTLARVILQGQGYNVTEAADGAAALKLLEAGGAFDLLVTDVRMPGADGGKVAARARELLPAVRVVFMSGFTDTEPAVPGSVFLPKPFPPAALARATEQAHPPRG